MIARTLPVTVMVSRGPARRVADVLRDAWVRWSRSRRERRALELLLNLDDRTLRDIGASAELRALAEARQGGAYQRMADLLR